MGNVNNQHILDIWNNEEYVLFRDSLKKGERDKHSICKNCNRVSENLRPENNKHFFGEEEINAIKRVVQKGNFFRYQEVKSECVLFEEEFSKKINSPYALLVTSGTNALILALEASGIGPGDEVIIPSYTYVATASAVVNVGAIPIIANIDNNLGLCPEDTASKISNKTKAIIPVHMDGMLANLDGLEAVANKHKLIIIEDAAQCLGGKFNGSYAGTRGDFGCFSLNMEKTLTAGEGGIVVTKTKEQYEKLCLLSDTGFGFSPHNKLHFNKPLISHSMRVSEITGAIMREQLKKIDLVLMAYKIRKKILSDHLTSLEGLELIHGHDTEGEIGVSLIIKFKDPEIALRAGSKLRSHRIAAIPVSLKPAHVSWKWSNALEHKTKHKYPKAEVLTSFEIIMCCLKIQIDLNLSIEKSHDMAISIRRILKNEAL